MLSDDRVEQSKLRETGFPNRGEGLDISKRSNLTHSQFLIWLGQSLAPDVPLYNMIQTFAFDTSLDVKIFQSAFQALVDRSDALRTVIEEVDGAPRQRVLESLIHTLEWIDLSGNADPEGTFRTWLDERRVRMHDLRTRLFDTALIQLGPNRFIWYLNQHHLITDGWSFVLVYRRMAELYEAFLRGGEVPGSELPAYADYVRHERTFRDSRSFARAEKYWADKMAAPSQPLTFYDSTPGRVTHRTERLVCDLGVERTARLKAIATEKGFQTLNPELSLYNLFVTLFTAYLSRLSGNSGMTLGSTFHNRPTPAFKETIGVFIEVCPLRLDVKDTDTFITLHQNVMRESMNVLLNALPGTSRAEYNRAYEALLNFVNVTFPPFAGTQPEVEWVHSGYGDRDHALRLQIHDFNATGSYKLHFDFNTQTFTSGQRELAIQHFLQVVDAFLEDRGQPIHRVSLLTASERALLIDSFNQTAADYPADTTIIDLFEQQVAHTPQVPALRLGATSLSYAELNVRAEQLAHYLHGQGVKVGSLVAISMEHSLEAVIAILGVLKAGGAYVPVDPADPPDRIRSILEDLGQYPVLLTQLHLSRRFDGLDVRLAVVDNSLSVDAAVDTDPLPSAAPDDLAYIIYTSGSTGRPKGVMIRHCSLVNYIWWARGQYLNGQVWDFPLFSSLSFDLTVTSIFTPLITGGQIVVYPDDPSARGTSILKVFEEDAVDIVKLTPAHLGLLRDMDFSRSRIQALILGGEDLKTELARSISASFNHQVAIYNEYGPTEATVGCMIHRYDPKADLDASVPVGRPINNAQVYVMDKNLQPVPPGIVGEMCIAGVGVARGYLHRPELTETRFVNNPIQSGSTLYRTGDLARWTPDGRMQFLGRSDHQVKIRGYRIELGEIENTLLEHPAIETAIVNVFQPKVVPADNISRRCVQCGLPDNYPGVTFDSAGVCNTCRDFSALKDSFRDYFKTPADLQVILDDAKKTKTGKYDSLVLYSGGKDSSYMLHQLVREQGMKPLVFSLDNGYISEEAKENIRRVTNTLGVDLVFGHTPHMNSVFVDSLKRHSNVCDGCFKVIYTLGIKLAREKGIKYIFTGLSRGQLFETRLSDMFKARIFDVEEIDRTVLDARKAYHRFDDAVKQLMDVNIFESDTLFDDVQLVDFFRYTDVSLQEMYRILDQNLSWVRPSDTGRSTNCLINDAGIYIHKKLRGFHNYALPYSWDVRMGHKTRAETIDELSDEIDEARVHRMLAEIGFDENEELSRRTEKRLIAYYVSSKTIPASELRQYLSARLPEYMIPVDFIQLEEMPLTINGKVNRTALPDPDSRRSTLETGYVPPATDRERQLATVWSQVFHIPEVGIHDNFFELGGDSIVSIQITTKAKQAGLHITPRDIFEQQTIARLALVTERDQDVTAEQGLVTGDVPLTPVQRWFLEQDFTRPHHWNQTVWLDVPENLDRDSLQSALNQLPKQHDMLRARFQRINNDIWQQSIPAESVPLDLEYYDLSSLAGSAQDAAVQERARQLESSLDLSAGPLLRAALISFGPGRPLRLMVTCHHLVIDGVSWQPLLSDWETAYHQIRRGQPVHLPPKTTSFKEWAEKLVKYSQSPALDRELDYWQSSVPANGQLQEMDHGKSPGPVQTLSLQLSESSTTALLHDVHRSYNTTVLDLLLTAWAQAYGDLTGGDTASVTLEGHGRETDVIGNADLSHTVGWFTTHYPVNIKMPGIWEPGSLLKQVKEHLRRIPNKGLGYSVLRYLRAESQLASQPSPPVLFNYLGQFEMALPASDLFTLAQPLQAGYSLENRRTHDLEVNAFVRRGQLHLEVSFTGGRFASEAVEKLIGSFANRLETLIAHCLSPDAGGYTPSDFALADLNEKQFNRLTDILNKLDGD